MKNVDTNSSFNGKIVGVDVGGTFTDLIMLDQQTGEVLLAKVPSTMENQAFGVLRALEQTEAQFSSIALIIHGTTTTTNAVLERKLCRSGLITTKGFRDILDLGRRTRPQAYGMKGIFRPIVPRDLRLEVEERLDATGEIINPLDAAAVSEAATRLLNMGCESVIIHFLHAYANPIHEKRAAKLVANIWPNNYITINNYVKL